MIGSGKKCSNCGGTVAADRKTCHNCGSNFAVIDQEFGDSEGHPFRGNQHTSGSDGGTAQGGPRTESRKAKQERLARFARASREDAKRMAAHREVAARAAKKDGYTQAVDSFKGRGFFRRPGEENGAIYDADGKQVATVTMNEEKGRAESPEFPRLRAETPKELANMIMVKAYEDAITAGGKITVDDITARLDALEQAILALAISSLETFGDTPGHPFHGNQYTGGQGGSSKAPKEKFDEHKFDAGRILDKAPDFAVEKHHHSLQRGEKFGTYDDEGKFQVIGTYDRGGRSLFEPDKRVAYIQEDKDTPRTGYRFEHGQNVHAWDPKNEPMKPIDWKADEQIHWKPPR